MKASPRELVRLVLAAGEVVIDRSRAGGRGAWLHPAEACLARASRRKSFGRAFRSGGAQAGAALARELLTGSPRKD